MTKMQFKWLSTPIEVLEGPEVAASETRE